MSKKLVTALCGHSFEVDVSDEACSRFGVKHGDTIVNKKGEWEGIVAGVARIKNWRRFFKGKKVLWIAHKTDGGEVVSYWRNFEEEGFRLK